MSNATRISFVGTGTDHPSKSASELFMPSQTEKHDIPTPYHEYYVVIDGEGELEVAGATVPMRAGTVVIVEPGEAHRVVSVSPSGCRWVMIKERSQPDSKTLESDPAV